MLDFLSMLFSRNKTCSLYVDCDDDPVHILQMAPDLCDLAKNNQKSLLFYNNRRRPLLWYSTRFTACTGRRPNLLI